MKTKLLLIISACIFAITACTKETESNASISDASLNSMNTSDNLSFIRTTKSGDNSEWQIKMNAIALKAYAAGCKTFPVNSMIVKERHNSSGQITCYDIMYRTNSDANSNGGWLWSEMGPSGNVIYGTDSKGVACQSCHSPDGAKPNDR